MFHRFFNSLARSRYLFFFFTFFIIIIIIIIHLFFKIYFIPYKFFARVLTGVCKSLQISKTLLNILLDFSDAVIWMVSIFLLIFNSPNFFSAYLGTVPTASTKIGITVTFMFPNSFSSRARSSYLSSYCFPGKAKSTRWQILFILIIKTWSGWYLNVQEYFKLQIFSDWSLVCLYSICCCWRP